MRRSPEPSNSIRAAAPISFESYSINSTMSGIYLDHNATTPLAAPVLEAMLPYFSSEYGNAASIHGPGQRARAAVERAREQVAALVAARPQEIVFTSGGTESDNHAVMGLVRAAKRTRRSGSEAAHVISTAIEHEAVLHACEELQRAGTAVTYVAVGRAGVVDPDQVRRAIQPNTVLISVMHANNETGTVQPLPEIAAIAREHKLAFHTDAVQSAGKIPIDVNALGVDLLTLSGHKFYGPKGIGALYVRTGTEPGQILFGGHHQRGFRPGTENVAGIVGLGKAAELARQLLPDGARLGALRDGLERGIVEGTPDCRVNGAGTLRVANTTNLCFAGIEGEALVIALDLKGIAISTGAACSSGAVEPSHVLIAMGLSVEQARSSVRFSLGRGTTAEEVNSTVEAVRGAVAQLRALAPAYSGKKGLAR
jgi:cysteine desulfurase